MGNKKIRIGFWWWYLFALIAVLLLISIFQKSSNHYVGEMPISVEQYKKITDNVELNKEKNYITPTAEGNILTYDFYSISKIDFLAVKPYTFVDSAFVNMIRKLIQDKFFIFMAIVYFTIYYFATYRRGWLYKVATKIRHYTEKQSDKKIPLLNFHRVVATPAEIKTDGERGILAIRSWGVDKKGVLKSLVQNTKWEGNTLKTDKLPYKENTKGIYGYRLGVNLSQKGEVMGIVSLDGEYSYHAEGIVRAEHCKILGFLMSKGLERTAKFISNEYNVPVYLAESAEVAYYDWLFSAEGQKALQHNYELLKEK